MLVASNALNRRVPHTVLRRSGPRWVWLWGGLAGLLLVLLWLVPYVSNGMERVRLRNALLLAPGSALPPAAFAWRADAPPADFALETRNGNPLFLQAAQALQLHRLPSDWERVRRISQHLLSHPQLQGTANHAGLDDSYRSIVRHGTGYCGDFTRAFMALALAAGMPVRAWSFSLDGFGGHGHIWPEVWNRQLQQWQLVDIFNNVYFARADGVALSALDMRQALTRADPTLRMLPLSPGARPGYADNTKAWDYYRRGLPEWYMAWGNAVFSQDQALLVRTLEPVSHTLAQLGAIAQGVSPRIHVLADTRSGAALAALQQLRYRLFVLAGFVLLCLLAMVWGALGLLRRARAQTPLQLQLRASASSSTTALPFGATPATHNRAGVGSALATPCICVVGPLPPPAGGMGNQCAQLVRLLRAEGILVELVQTNAAYRPAWLGGIPLLRAALRLPPYVLRLWQSTGRTDVVHVLANSGWAWHLFAAPAVAIARLQGKPVIVHFHGGLAEAFLARAPAPVRWLLAGATLRVLPSPYLQRIFARKGLAGEVIANCIDRTLFHPPPQMPRSPHILVSRHLEAIYDIASAIRAFALVHQQLPLARLTVAGSGPELARLQALAALLGVADAVSFVGRIDNHDMPALLASASCLLNPSRVDNMPVSILEAFACGVPVVSTNAGGVPDLLRHGHTGLLVPVGDEAAMARQLLRVLQDQVLAWSLRRAALAEAENYSWPRVRTQWLGAYLRAISLNAALRAARSGKVHP